MPFSAKGVTLASATGACFFFFWLGSLILSWVILPVASLPLRRRPRIERIHRCQDIVGRAFRLFIAGMRVTRTLVFRPRRVELNLPDGPFVMIANHPTLIDVTALMTVHPRICCIAKSELFASAFVGPLLRRCGHIESGSRGLADREFVLRQALDRIAAGLPVLVFPEGSRSPEQGLRRFKDGAFEIAARAGVPIVPVLITCDPPTLKKGSQWYGLPKRTAWYDVTQLRPDLSRVPANGAGAMAAHFHELFLAELDKWKATLPELGFVPPHGLTQS